jgi:LuxR family transcriptional regulator, maltose regulon positive regulatory protein
MIAHERGTMTALSTASANRRRLGSALDPDRLAAPLGTGSSPPQRIAGEWDDALKFLDAAQRGYVKNPIPMLQPIEAHKVRIYLKQGRLDKAQAWVRERGLSVKDDANYLGEYEHLTLARTRLAERSFEGVGNLLERLLALAESQKRTGSVIEILLTQALLHQAQGDQPQAFAALERALTLTEPEGYIRIFVDEGEAMRLLISEFRSMTSNRAHPLLGYVDRILTYFPQPKKDGLQSKIANQNLKSSSL